MSVVPQGCPRAYVAAPVAAATGLFQAITWAFAQSEDLTWGDLRILVADSAMVQTLGSLHRLKARGVRIGTVGQAARARAFSGVVIAYCPDRAMLAAAENLPGVRALAVVARHNEELSEWVTANDPQHLGGGVLSIPPQGGAQVSARSEQPLQTSL